MKYYWRVFIFLEHKAGNPRQYTRVRQMTPHHNEIIRQKLDSTIYAGPITPATSAWSLNFVTVTKKRGNSCSCVAYRTFIRKKKTERLPLPII